MEHRGVKRDVIFADLDEMRRGATTLTVVEPTDPVLAAPATGLQCGRTFGVIPSPYTVRNALVAPYQSNQGP